MNSAGSLKQTGTLSQQGGSDFLEAVFSITEPDTGGVLNTLIAGPMTFDLFAGRPLVDGPMVAAGPIAAASPFDYLVTAGNFSINLEFDSNAANAGGTFASDIEQAASIIVADLKLSRSITVNLQIGYEEKGASGGAALGGPSNGTVMDYATVRTDLLNNAPGDPTFDALPIGTITATNNGSNVVSYSSLEVWLAQEKALGIIPGNGGEVDGLAYFGNGISADLLVGVALHELTHALGRVPDGTAYPDIFDLFRFTAAGTILASDQTGLGAPAYFSVDGGTTSLATYGSNSDPSDYLNTGGLEDPFTEYYGVGTPQTLTALDLQQMDVLGFSAACFAEGTRLATPNGQVAVETLSPGMKLLTVSGATRPVRWIGRRRLDLSRHPAPEEVCPIRIRAGALGEGVPVRDLRLSPEHALFLDGGLVPVRLLVNGCSILRENACRSVVWYHVELEFA